MLNKKLLYFKIFKIMLLRNGESVKKRCTWVNLKNDKYIKYHDEEWGRLNLDEKYLYEMFILETFQAGLSWECILNKRENFKKAFCDFEISKVCLFDDKKINEMLNDEGLIRNKLKIKASINNSLIFKDICYEYSGFKNYLLSFVPDIIFEHGKVENDISKKISLDLKKRGMKFVGSVTIYSYLQAVGLINSHDKDCFLSKA